jgi:hypothetical protein
MTARDPDGEEADTPIFDAAAFRLDRNEADLIDSARRFRCTRARRAAHDPAMPPSRSSFRDMHEACLLISTIPKADVGASYRTYCLAAAELGRYCGAALYGTCVSSTLWTGALADDL